MTDKEFLKIVRKNKDIPPDELAKKIGMPPLDFKLRIIELALKG